MQSERLNIFQVPHPPTPGLTPRTVYLGFDKHGDWPGVVVSMCLWPEYSHYVDWIQVSDVQRGHGYGQELIEFVESDLKIKLLIDPTSKSCEQMLARMGRD